MRPSTILLGFLFFIVLQDLLLVYVSNNRLEKLLHNLPAQHRLVNTLGLADLALTTEARYTRHPSVSDPLASYMDHPGSIEHFPSGSFVLPVVNVGR